MGEVNGKKRRPYRSAVRTEGARRTQQAIMTTASALFIERGYGSTSLADIAAAAGVARPTVFATFGSKAALLQQVLDEALAGDEAPVAVAERPWFRPVWDAKTTAAVLDAYAQVCLVIARRTALLFETVRRAADDAPEAADLWNRLQDSRLAGAMMVVEHIRALDAVTPSFDAETATDLLWIFNDPAHYGSLVLGRGWTEDAFTRWLAASMRHAVLAC